MSKLNLELFFTAFTQVILVCLNTYQIALFAKSPSSKLIIGIFVVGFAISFIWSFNVKKISLGTLKNRLWYSFGAAFGSIIGVWLGLIMY